MKVALAFLRSFGLFLLTLPMILVGLPVVAVALRFRVTDPATRPFTQYAGLWQFVTLPAWASPWSNQFDGALGDKRGWWDNYCQANYGKDCRALYSMWQWLAIRNNANTFKRLTCGVDVSECTLTLMAGQAVVSDSAGAPFGWSLVKATRSDGKVFPRFLLIAPYKNGTHAAVIDMGWKVKMSHQGTLASDRPSDRFKGLVCLVTPWKEL